MRLQTIGWEDVKPGREKIVDPNVGEFLDAVRSDADLKSRTFEIYAQKFRQVAAGVANIKSTARTHDYRNGGRQEWLDRVRSVKLSRLTTEAVQHWKLEYLAQAGGNPARERSRRHRRA
jgi:hypothetical protein